MPCPGSIICTTLNHRYVGNAGIVIWVRKGKIMVKCGAAPPFYALIIGNSFGFVQFPKQNQYILQLLGTR